MSKAASQESFAAAVDIASRLAGGAPEAFLRIYSELYCDMLRQADLLHPARTFWPIPGPAAARVAAAIQHWRVAGTALVATRGGFQSCVALGTISSGAFDKDLTGVLIDSSVVLTAAHDTGPEVAAFTNDLMAGGIMTRSIYNWSPPAESIWPPAGGVAVDVVIAYLTTGGPGSAALLATSSEIASVSSGWVVKYGQDGKKTHVDVTFAPCNGIDCEAATELAAWDPVSPDDLCSGDSGAPLFIDIGGVPKVAGILSRPLSTGICSRGAVFSRPDRVTTWLGAYSAPP
jgi:hypothetical protein